MRRIIGFAYVAGLLTSLVLSSGASAGPGLVVGVDDDTAKWLAQLRDALTLAYCQPAVGAFFNFELIDEHRLASWQSGLLWSDGTQKPSYAGFRDAIAAVAAGAVDCSALAGNGPATP